MEGWLRRRQSRKKEASEDVRERSGQEVAERMEGVDGLEDWPGGEINQPGHELLQHILVRWHCTQSRELP